MSSAEILLVLLQCLMIKGDLNHEDFLICPARGNEETLDCGPGGEIDVTYAWVAKIDNPLLQPCSNGYNWREYLNMNNKCITNLSFLSCHGKQSCVLNGSLAKVRLPNCQKMHCVTSHKPVEITLSCNSDPEPVTARSTATTTRPTTAFTRIATSFTRLATFFTRPATSFTRPATSFTRPATSFTRLATATTTASYPPAGVSQPSADSEENESVIVGSVLGVLLLIVLIVLIVVIVICRKKYIRKQQSTAAPSGVTKANTPSVELNGGRAISGYINASVVKTSTFLHISGSSMSYQNMPRTYVTNGRGREVDDTSSYENVDAVSIRSPANGVETGGNRNYENAIQLPMVTKER